MWCRLWSRIFRPSPIISDYWLWMPMTHNGQKYDCIIEKILVGRQILGEWITILPCMASLRAPEYSKQILNYIWYVASTFSKHILWQMNINRMIRNIQMYIKIIKYHRLCTFFRTILILKWFWLQRKLQTWPKLRVVATVYVRPFSSSSNSCCV